MVPGIGIYLVHSGIDVLAELRQKIATCSAHLHEKPEWCTDQDDHQFQQADSTAVEGEDTLRISERWLRAEPVAWKGFGSRCFDYFGAERFTQVQGFLVVSKVRGGGWLSKGDTPPMPLDKLDALQTETVRNIKAAERG